MRKLVSIVLTVMMIATCGAFNTGIVNGKSTRDINQNAVSVNSENSNIVTVSSADKKKISATGSEQEYKSGEVLVMYEDAEPANKKEAKAILTQGADTTADENDIAGFAVKSVWDFEGNAAATEGAQSAKTKATENSIKTAADEAALEGTSVALIDTGNVSVKEAIEILSEDKNVRYAEPNYRIEASVADGESSFDVANEAQETADSIPGEKLTNDEYSSFQWGLEDIKAESAWKELVGSDEAVVAVVDTGIDYTHVDLKDNMWVNPYQSKGLKGEHGFDFINPSRQPIDDNGHGTHCSGIISGCGNNGIGISGVNQNTSLMALKILDDEGTGYGSEEIAAYNYINRALDLGVNIVAINNSYGGAEYSAIMEELITLVGSKGAVSAFASGNSAEDLDEYAESDEAYYPASYYSPYKLVVDACREDGGMVSFSNYGKNLTDLGAPGTNILSTVCYNCYNPVLYGNKNDTISKTYYNFDGSIPSVKVSGPTEATISKGEGFYGSAGSMKLSIPNAKEGVYNISIPYSLSTTDYKQAPQASITVRSENAPYGSFFEAADLLIIDAPASTEVTEDNITDLNYDVTSIDGQMDYWTHLRVACCDEDCEQPPIASSRQVVLSLYVSDAGNYEILLDDFGISNEDQSGSFGKYDFFSGTSMATPFVTGALALANIRLQNESRNTSDGEGDISESEYVSYDPENVVNDVVSSVTLRDDFKDTSATGGCLDLSQNGTNTSVKISKVLAGKGRITIAGSGFNLDGLKVRIGDETVDESNIISADNHSIVIEDKGWINCLEDITVSGTNKAGNKRETTREDVYLVSGKTAYKTKASAKVSKTVTTALAKGKKMYMADSGKDSITVMTPSSSTAKAKNAVKVTKSRQAQLFKTYTDDDSRAKHDFVFGDDLVSIGGNLYNFASFVECADNYSVSPDDEDEDYDEDYEEEWDSPTSSNDYEYFRETLLLRLNPSTGKTSKIKLPAELKETEDYTLASYGSKIYVLGGYRYETGKNPDTGKTEVTGTFNRNVYVYNPKSGKWSIKKNVFPADRAGGKAVQTGSKLVYTLGYGSDEDAVATGDQEKYGTALKNIVFDGSSWKVMDEVLHPYVEGETVTRDDKDYTKYTCSVAPCSGGIVYVGFNVKDYGDTFTYSISKDAYKDTGYNYFFSIPEENSGMIATAIGSKIYAIDQTKKKAKLSVANALK